MKSAPLDIFLSKSAFRGKGNCEQKKFIGEGGVYSASLGTKKDLTVSPATALSHMQIYELEYPSETESIS